MNILKNGAYKSELRAIDAKALNGPLIRRFPKGSRSLCAVPLSYEHLTPHV